MKSLRYASNDSVKLQVEISKNLFLPNVTQPSSNKTLNFQTLLSFLKSDLRFDQLKLLQGEINEEIISRTTQLRNMIPSEVWSFIFQLVCGNEDISFVFKLRTVSKQWNFIIPFLEQVNIVKAKSIHSYSIRQLCNLRLLSLYSPCVLPPCQSYSRLETLTIHSLNVNFHQVYSSLTNLRSLSFLQSPYYFSNLLDSPDKLSRKLFKSLPSLKKLTLDLSYARASSSFLNTLSFLTSLEELVIASERIPPRLELYFGDDLKCLQNLSKLCDIKMPKFDFLNCYRIQEKFPLTRFLWVMSPLGSIRQDYSWDSSFQLPVHLYEGKFSETNQFEGEGKAIYSNGEMYVGQFKNNNREGKGIYYSSKSQIVYEGQFSNDYFHGFGKYFASNGDRYEGHFVYGMREGEGKCFFASGGRHEGHYTNNLRNGEGKFFFSNGQRLEGKFEDGHLVKGKYFYPDGRRYEGQFNSDDGFSFHGKGKFFHANGDIFEGDFVNEKYANGKYSFSDGRVYEGQFENWKFHGLGCMWHPGGNLFEGEFLNNNFHVGQLFYPDESWYQGPFVNNRFQGFGTFFFPDGSRYEGQFFDDKFHGFGKFYDSANGNRFEGEFWNNNFLVGKFFFPDGSRYEGPFVNNRFQGFGTFFFLDGSRYEGQFFEDEFHGFGIFFDLDGDRHERNYFKGKIVGEGK